MPPLPDELVEEIFLRLPPAEPAALVRASLASKPWLGLLTSPAFREFHGAPPMLGFLCSRANDSGHEEDPAPRFVSTAKFGARIPDFTSTSPHHSLDAWDCRHGRVLLGDNGYSTTVLVVWDPMTGCTRELSGADSHMVADSFDVAVLCAVSGCDHCACHAGPFKVIYVGVGTAKRRVSVLHSRACRRRTRVTGVSRALMVSMGGRSRALVLILQLMHSSGQCPLSSSTTHFFFKEM